MIPYLLAVVGGYLLGDSMKESEKKMADGGKVDDEWYEYKGHFMSSEIVDKMGYFWDNMDLDSRLKFLDSIGYSFVEPEIIKDKKWSSFSDKKKAEFTYHYGKMDYDKFSRSFRR